MAHIDEPESPQQIAAENRRSMPSAPDHRCCKTRGCPGLAQFASPSGDYRIETLYIRINRALELNVPMDPYKLLMYNGQPTRIMNLPTQDLRALSGYGHQESDIRQRSIVPLPDGFRWQWKPQECRVADGFRGVWVDEEHLACPGCGMDFT